jgi:peroxiredoxin
VIETALFGEDAMLRKGKPAPDFSVQNQHGDEVSLATYRGTKLLLWFMARGKKGD